MPTSLLILEHPSLYTWSILMNHDNLQSSDSLDNLLFLYIYFYARIQRNAENKFIKSQSNNVWNPTVETDNILIIVFFQSLFKGTVSVISCDLFPTVTLDTLICSKVWKITSFFWLEKCLVQIISPIFRKRKKWTVGRSLWQRFYQQIQIISLNK